MAEVRTSALLWCTVTVLLLLVTFGLRHIIYGLLYFVCFIAGLIVIFYEHSAKEVSQQRNYLTAPISQKTAPVCQGVSKVLAIDDTELELINKQTLTSSPCLDDKINACLDYLMRDYVKYWYNSLSDRKEFLHFFRSLLQDTIRDIAMRMKATDWQPYLSTVLVDQFASHLRYFRKAKLKVESSGTYDEHQDHYSYSTDHSECFSDMKDCEYRSNLLESFFNNETLSENLCRDVICNDAEKQLCYLRDISEVLLFIMLPEKDFHCKPLKYLLRETVIHGIFRPMFKLYSNPDYLNQYVSWLISDNCVSSEWFLSVLRHTTVMGELRAVCEKAEEEFGKLKSKDAVGDDPVVKQQLSSMRYVMKVCQRQMRKQHEGSFEPADLDIANYETDKSKLYHLPLSVILRNNIALQTFIDYMQSVNGQAYLFFWLTIDGFRASAEQQLKEGNVQQLKKSMYGTPVAEVLRSVQQNIYEQYFSKHSDSKVPLDPLVDKQLKRKIDTGEPYPYIFDDVQQKVFVTMQKDERFYPGFKASKYYLKLLAELDLLQEPSINSMDTNESHLSGSSQEDSHVLESDETSKLSAEITQTGICTDHGKSYALYAITVTRQWSCGKEESWSTFRRYREFYDLHASLKESGSNLGNLRLPGKTLFKDLQEEFLEKRRVELNQYLNTLLEKEHPVKGMECLHTFLDAKAYQRSSKSLARKVDTMMRSSVKSVSNFVAQAPDNFLDGIQKASDKVSDGFQKFSDMFPGQMERKDDDVKLMEQIDYNIQNNIPLGILLLLLDEVFDLKQKNQWLRRQMVAAVQQIVRALYGDKFNKKIIDYVENALSAEQIATYIDKFKDNFWPNGILADDTAVRDEETVKRTCVLTKTKMHGVIPDEFRPVVGNETCRKGIMLLFELLQYEELNQRFCIVLLEGVLKKIFPSNKFSELFVAFHSSSPKVRAMKRDKLTRGSEKRKTSTANFKPSANKYAAVGVYDHQY